jgi:hypothetical protein
MSHYQEQGYFASIPDWSYDAAVLLALLGFIYWAWTQDDIQRFCRWGYNRRPKMLLVILMIVGAILGSGAGAFGYWAIKKQQRHASLETQVTSGPTPSPSPSPSAAPTPAAATSSPSAPKPPNKELEERRRRRQQILRDLNSR